MKKSHPQTHAHHVDCDPADGSLPSEPVVEGLGDLEPAPGLGAEAERADGADEPAEGGDAPAGPALGAPAAHRVPHAGVGPVPADEELGAVGLEHERAVPQVPRVREAQGRGHGLNHIDRFEQGPGLQQLQIKLPPNPPPRLLVADAFQLEASGHAAQPWRAHGGFIPSAGEIDLLKHYIFAGRPGVHKMAEIEVRYVVRNANNKLRFKRGFFLSTQAGEETFGSFLGKYGKTILQSLNFARLADTFVDGSIFPMKLSLKTDSSERVFDNSTKTSKLVIPLNDNTTVLFLEQIPIDEESKFIDNVDFTSAVDSHTHRIDHVQDFTGQESDQEKVLDVLIEYNSDRGGGEVQRAKFHFLKAKVQGISHGIFLSKYGNDILRVFSLELMPFKSSSFSMELKFYDVFDMGERFDNLNRDELLTWNKKYLNHLILSDIEQVDAADFNQNVTDDEYILSECSFCFDELYKPVHINEYMVLPQIKELDSVSFNCNHRFHTHCVLKSCQYGHKKCIRCTVDPGKEFWGKFYIDSRRAIDKCFTQFNNEIRNMESNLEQKKIESMQLHGNQIQINGVISELERNITLRNEIKKVLNQELDFLDKQINTEQTKPLNTQFSLRNNVLNQLDTLLERFLLNN